MKNTYSTSYIVEFLRLLSEESLIGKTSNKIKGFESREVRQIFRIAADKLEEASKKDINGKKLPQSFRNSLPISQKTKEVLSKLSPVEEKSLLENFGLLEPDGAI